MKARWSTPVCAVVLAMVFAAPVLAQVSSTSGADAFASTIVVPGLGENEAMNTLEPKPEVFIQTRFARGRVTDAPEDTTQNFQLTRLETRWSGRLTSHVGVGLELQFHPALAGAAEELVNDAFVEFYAPGHTTVRVGQFIKPFGFDIQQSSSAREYAERGIFAGYFFPGQRDRGVMLIWNPLAETDTAAQTTVYAAALNGNRFFADNDGRLDTVLRVRTRFPHANLAIGGSVQLGSQIVPPASDASRDVRLAGADAQFAVGRLGFRAEVVTGTRPSTLLALEPEFTTAFGRDTHRQGSPLPRSSVSDMTLSCSADSIGCAATR
ncbi:MAG: porin [Vicinamibacterales bacterium]